MVYIKKGLDVPIPGAPKQTINERGLSVSKVALVGSDYVGMKPSMLVKVGDIVKIGDPLFSCKKNIGVVYTSPGSGKIIEINRGERRVFESIVIQLDGKDSQREFSAYSKVKNNCTDRHAIRELLVESGLWSSLRVRPFSKNPEVETFARNIFVTATDTNPLAIDPKVIIEEYKDDFKKGLEAISLLSDGKVFLCNGDINFFNEYKDVSNVELHEFKGKHPAGNVGTHIHHLSPVSIDKSVWHVGYQDVIAVGKLIATGRLWTERVISLAGPLVKKPRAVNVRLGANTDEVIKNELIEDISPRIISGSVLKGTRAKGHFTYLGRYNNQISVIEEGTEQEFIGWIMPGMKKFSATSSFISKFLPFKNYKFTSHLNGGKRSIVPIGLYEKVVPLDILPTQLLISLMSNDIDQAIALGCLELDEEDLALCTFVCPGKQDYGVSLRNMLTTIEKEG